MIEDDLWLKLTFDGGWPSKEDYMWWKTTFDGRKTLIADDPRRNMTFNARQPLEEEKKASYLKNS